MIRAGQGLVLAVVSLLVIGVVMVNSAGLTVDAQHAISIKQVLLSKQTILASLAMLALLGGSFLCIEKIFTARGLASPMPWLIVGIFFLLLVVHVPGIGHEVNGARRWISLGSFQFQPSEVAKWGMVVVLAWYAARRAGTMNLLWSGFIPPMVLVGVVCGLIALEDLGTAVLIFMVAVGMLLAAGCRIWQAALLVPPAVVGFIGLVLVSPYRVNRILAYLDPYADPEGIGYHIIQSMTAVAGGGLVGRGLGNSIQKFGYLPEDTTDFIFAIICEELGLVGAVAVVALYVMLLVCGLAILKRPRHPFERLVGLGVLLTIGLQAFINIAVVTGMAPTKGIALPLLSAGGTGWVLTAFSVGLLVAMDRADARKEALEAREAAEADPLRDVAGYSEAAATA
jgi:cell division protein FtsW